MFADHSSFWGVVVAPNYVLGGGSGNPQNKVWGALTGSSLNTNAQFAVHYDQGLKDISHRPLPRGQLALGTIDLTRDVPATSTLDGAWKGDGLPRAPHPSDEDR